MRRPASLSMQTDAREAPGNTALPPLRAGRVVRQCEAEGRRRRATSKALPGRARRPINRRGGAPRGERPPARGRRKPPGTRRAIAPAGLRHWPAYGCRCTRAPVGAPPPHFWWGDLASLGGLMPREKDDACADFRPRVRAKRSPRAAPQTGESRTPIGAWYGPGSAAHRPLRPRCTAVPGHAASPPTTPGPLPPHPYPQEPYVSIHPVTLVQ